MASRSPSDLKKLLTTSEFDLVQASHGAPLAKATPAALGAAVVRARALRDKWRDQFRKQQRTTHTARGRGAGGNDRSQEKSAVFAEAVARFEARLAELGAAPAVAIQAGRRKATPARSARAHGHRAARAQTRAALAEHTTVSPGRKITSAAVSKPTAKPTATTTVKSEAAPAKAAKPKLMPGRGASKKRLRGAAPATTALGTRPLAVDPLRQVKVASKLKASRVRLAGLDTRGRAHASAQVRRKQGRRDSRGRG